ncbi:glycosyltransferase family 39 protein, partial [Candidatus Woesebacteria bacterium]|nr:glycosyltransferase family 39 protein [Candidatus Woesebacteria bacterium]
MNQAYQTVFVSFIACITLCGGIALFVYRFPKKKLNPPVLLLLFSLLPIISIFRTGVYQSGDLTLHTTWLMSFFRSLSEGNIFPQWAADRVGGLGYPTFTFQYQTPYYLASLFHFLGLSFITSAKMVYVAAYLASAVTMYLWAKEEFGKKAAFVATFLYQFSPYYLVQMHFVNSFGETLSFAVLPLAFFGIIKYVSTLKYRWFVFAAVGFALTILTHQTVGLTSSLFLAVYLVLTSLRYNRSPKQIFVGLLALLCGVLLTAYYWLPALQLSQYIQQASNHTMFFANFRDFFFTPWKFGLLYQGSLGEVGWILGYPQWIVIALFSFLLFKNKIAKTDRSRALFFFSSFCVLFILMQSVTKPFWQLPLVNNFRLSTRLLLITAFFVSAVGAITVRNVSFLRLERLIKIRNSKEQTKQQHFFKKIRSNLFGICICSLALATTILNWGNRTMLPDIDDQYLLNNEYVNYVDPSLLPIWYKPNLQDQSRVSQIFTEHFEILAGEGTVQEIHRTSTNHLYQVTAQTPLSVRENTLYFPGWAVLLNGQATTIS